MTNPLSQIGITTRALSQATDEGLQALSKSLARALATVVHPDRNGGQPQRAQAVVSESLEAIDSERFAAHARDLTARSRYTAERQQALDRADGHLESATIHAAMTETALRDPIFERQLIGIDATLRIAPVGIYLSDTVNPDAHEEAAKRTGRDVGLLAGFSERISNEARQRVESALILRYVGREEQARRLPAGELMRVSELLQSGHKSKVEDYLTLALREILDFELELMLLETADELLTRSSLWTVRALNPTSRVLNRLDKVDEARDAAVPAFLRSLEEQFSALTFDVQLHSNGMVERISPDGATTTLGRAVALVDHWAVSSTLSFHSVDNRDGPPKWPIRWNIGSDIGESDVIVTSFEFSGDAFPDFLRRIARQEHRYRSMARKEREKTTLEDWLELPRPKDVERGRPRIGNALWMPFGAEPPDLLHFTDPQILLVEQETRPGQSRFIGLGRVVRADPK